MQKVSKRKKILNILANILFGIIIVLCLFVSISSLISRANGGVTNIFGSAPMAVRTESMTGKINKGDLIVVKMIKFDEDGNTSQEFIPNETIVSFRFDIDQDRQEDIVTHMFIGKEGKYFNFQGTYRGPDGNQEPAVQVVTYESIIGVYTGTRIAHLGSFMLWINSPTGFLVMFVLPIFIYFCYRGYILYVTYQDVKRERAIELGKLTEEEKEAERQRLREELLKELNEQKQVEEENKKD